jgi:hypothetical protein
MEIKHILGAVEGYDSIYDGDYLYSPNTLHIWSNNINCDCNLFIDARDLNSTTTYNLELFNKGFTKTTANNMLRFVMKDDSNFTWKNIFLGDANGSDNIVADVKYIVAHGGVYPSGTHYGDFPLPDLEGSNTGIYDKRKVFFFNHADLNRDRKVDSSDLEIFIENWGGNSTTDPNTFGSYVGSDPNDLGAYSDINRDGKVDMGDFSIFSGEWLWNADDPNTW